MQIVIEMPVCAGCCNAVTCGDLECRSAGGAGGSDATICGFKEYTSPSLPPKKYKEQTLFMDYTNCSWGFGVGSCTGDHAETYHSSGPDGSSSLQPITCAYNSDCSGTSVDGSDNFAAKVQAGSTCVAAPQTITNFQASFACSTTLSTPPPPALFSFDLITYTQTALHYTGKGVCDTLGSGSYNIYIGSWEWDLQAEDTIFDAIDRVGYGSFSAWGDCATNYSFISQRGADEFTSSFAKAEARRCGCITEIGESYTATLTTQKRLTGSSDPFVAGPSVIVGFTATSTSECVEIEVPQIDQYEVQAVNIFVTKS